MTELTVTLTPGAERLHKARQEAAAELKLEVSDWRTKRFAMLAVAHEGLQARLAAGADYSIDDLLKIETAMAEIRASIPPEPQTIKLHIVPPTDHASPGVAAVDDLIECRRCRWKPEGSDRVTRCYRCGWKHGDDANAPWKNMLSPSDPAAEEGENVSGSSKAARHRGANSAQKVKPHPNDLPRKNPGSIHDAPGARMRRTDYSGVALVGGGYDPRQPEPKWDSAHSLPPSPWPII